MLRREEGYFIMDYFMHDFRFHFISDYILFKPLISLMGQPDIVVEMAKPYLDIVALSFHLFFQAYKQFADGNQILKVLCGLLSLGTSSMSSSIIFDLWDLDFS
jgi:hypothetical protein